jgi:hypothetical protein
MLLRRSFASFLVLQSEASQASPSSGSDELDASCDFVLDWRWFEEDAASSRRVCPIDGLLQVSAPS